MIDEPLDFRRGFESGMGAELEGSLPSRDSTSPLIFILSARRALKTCDFLRSPPSVLKDTSAVLRSNDSPSASARTGGLPTQYVIIWPFPFTAILPRRRKGKSGACSFKSRAEASLHWIPSLVERPSIRAAVFMVSPNNPYRGLRDPMTLLTTGPEWNPTRI